MRPIPWVFSALLVVTLQLSTLTVTVSAQPVLPHQVQGNGAVSPMVGQTVTVQGVITANGADSFFIQTVSADEDGDPNTSEGLFVAGGTGLGVGTVVDVTGPVVEIGGAEGTVTALGFGSTAFPVGMAAAPPPISLTEAELSPAGSPGQLERFEGMRVAASLRAVNGTGFDGSFFAVLETAARPFREPGKDVGSPLPCAIGPCLFTTFDGNPERLRVDSDFLAATVAPQLSTGAVMTVVGPLHFESGAFTLLPESTLEPSGGTVMSSAPVTPSGEFSIASLNLGELMADEDTQRAKASLMVRSVLNAPDIVAVQRADAAVLEALALRIDSDAAAAGDPAPGYVAQLDGFLVKASRVAVVSADVVGADEVFDGVPLFERAPMMLRVVVSGGAADPPQNVTVLNSQFLPNTHVHLDDPTGAAARAQRLAQAAWLATFIQSRQVTDPSEKLVSLGNFNAHAFNDGYVDVMGAVSGTPALADRVVLDSPDLVNPDLANLTEGLAADARYTSVGNGNAQSLDHMLVSSNLLSQVSNFTVARVNADFPELEHFFPDNPLHLSDRDPAVAYFTFAHDATAPVFDAVPQNVVAEATGPLGAAVPYAEPTATDDVDGPVPVTCAPAAGSVFALGSSDVECTARDAAGNQNAVSFAVTVRDTTAPVLTVPSNITVQAADPAGRAVSFSVSASDLVTAVPAVVCSPASGSTFPLGTTTVNCTASDGAGNSSAASFTVTVTAASESVPHRMFGEGALKAGRRDVIFSFDVRSPAKAGSFGSFALKIKDRKNDSDSRGSGNAFDVQFSDRTVRFKVKGPWNGRRGYRFEVTATDGGKRGRHDRFTVVITAPNGKVVESISGLVSHGDIVYRY